MIKRKLQKSFLLAKELFTITWLIFIDKLGVSNAIEAYNKTMDLGYIDPVM